MPGDADATATTVAAASALRELQRLLAQDDPQATEWLARHDALLRRAFPVEQAALAQHVSRFDFGAALDVLERMPRRSSPSDFPPTPAP